LSSNARQRPLELGDGMIQAKREVAPGAFHLRRHLTADEQREVSWLCLELGSRTAGFYTPVVRGGHPMSVRMLCLGRHWNAQRYAYEDVRSDVDGHAVPPLPDVLSAIAARAASDAGFAFSPDICIVNWYGAASRMGLHQDKDESPESIASGAPVVSLSIGDTARFLFGGMRRKDAVEPIHLESGDLFVFGGPARLRYHGVTRILPGTAPAGLGFDGRLNLTFRRF
jgi:alkylated DNA repair protein (DNA oxidative demethylase)